MKWEYTGAESWGPFVRLLAHKSLDHMEDPGKGLVINWLRDVLIF
jgi:hypothetical protein